MTLTVQPVKGPIIARNIVRIVRDVNLQDDEMLSRLETIKRENTNFELSAIYTIDSGESRTTISLVLKALENNKGRDPKIREFFMKWQGEPIEKIIDEHKDNVDQWLKAKLYLWYAVYFSSEKITELCNGHKEEIKKLNFSSWYQFDIWKKEFKKAQFSKDKPKSQLKQICEAAIQETEQETDTITPAQKRAFEKAFGLLEWEEASFSAQAPRLDE